MKINPVTQANLDFNERVRNLRKAGKTAEVAELLKNRGPWISRRVSEAKLREQRNAALRILKAGIVRREPTHPTA